KRMKSSGREILRRTFLVSRLAGNITLVSSLVLEFLPLLHIVVSFISYIDVSFICISCYYV
ncbi:hypothetical protein, partial [uncultured Prevotella sp.]|uniref:hypothetical protein n=1 Tax=uncultured Prevotella sp. TaxID=159272 RepID=UPI002622953E